MKKNMKSLAIAIGAALAFGMMGCQPNVEQHVHTYSDTWSKDETHHWHVANCEHSDEVKDRAEHGFGDWSKGKKSCGTCGYEVVCQHSFGEWNTTKEATETEGGLKVRVCSVCNFEDEQPTPNLSHVHNWSDKWNKNESIHWKTCSGCSEENERAAHTWNDGDVTKSATCTEKGEKTYTCTVCGQTKPEDIAAKGHSYSDSWTKGETSHWHACQCGEKKDEAPHSFTLSKKSGATDEWEIKCACGKVSSSFHAPYFETIGAYTDLGSGNYTFGVYPQTIKASTVTVDKSVKNPEITGADYYLGSDGAWYAECVENGYATGSDLENSQYKYSDGSYVAEKNSSSPKTLYFKVEPIEWTKLSTTGCLVAGKILTAGLKWADSSNNYENSSIRSWLNGSFYNSAFTSSQQAKIKITTVDNSIASTGCSTNAYVCNDTSDRIFLLSFKEAFKDNGLDNNKRGRFPTDYALANRCYKDSSTGSTFGSSWWLRSPDNTIADMVREVNLSDQYSAHVDDTSEGVVPALSISEGK